MRAVLPDYEQEILHKRGMGQRIAAFASRFQDRYFPLPDGFTDPHWVESYDDLVARIPLTPLGVGWENLHDMAPIASGRDPITLMTYLVKSPDEEQVHIALAEHCLSLVPRELLERVPPEAYSRETLHMRLDNTAFEALALWADVLHQESEPYFFNIDAETADQEDIPWSRHNVETLTREWQTAERIQNQLEEFWR